MIETTMNPYDNDPIKMVIGSTRTLTEKELKELLPILKYMRSSSFFNL